MTRKNQNLANFALSGSNIRSQPSISGSDSPQISCLPGPPADLAEILDPSGMVREAFCDEADDELRLNILVENLRRRELKDAKNSNVALNYFSISRHKYTFPIFDRNYRRAVVVGSHLWRSWYWKPDGKFRGSIEIGVGASIYEKRNGRWRFIKFNLFSAGHG